jgi:hypothetical protein
MSMFFSLCEACCPAFFLANEEELLAKLRRLETIDSLGSHEVIIIYEVTSILVKFFHLFHRNFNHNSPVSARQLRR